MANAWLLESIRVGAGLSSPVLQRALPCTTDPRSAPVEPGLRRRGTSHTRSHRRVRRIGASHDKLTGTDRMLAVDISTFSADGLRTGGELGPCKLDPLLEEEDPKNDSPKNYPFWTFAAHMTQTPQKKMILPNSLLFSSFCLLKQTIILSDLKGVFDQSCRLCISKTN